MIIIVGFWLCSKHSPDFDVQNAFHRLDDVARVCFSTAFFSFAFLKIFPLLFQFVCSKIALFILSIFVSPVPYFDVFV